MTFKEFVNWCNCRAADGCLGLNEAMICVTLVCELKSNHSGNVRKSGRRWKMR